MLYFECWDFSHRCLLFPLVTEPQFSMPIQCTDVTAERAEASFSSSSSSSSSAAARASVDEPVPAISLATSGIAVSSLAISSLASRGASPEDADSVDSLKISVKFPPRTDSEYDFLNSTPEKPLELPPGTGHRTGLLASVLPTIEEPSKELGMSFAYPSSLPSSPSIPSVSSSAALETVRGPQQVRKLIVILSLWSDISTKSAQLFVETTLNFLETSMMEV